MGREAEGKDNGVSAPTGAEVISPGACPGDLVVDECAGAPDGAQVAEDSGGCLRTFGASVTGKAVDPGLRARG